MIKRYLLAALMMISSALYLGAPVLACSTPEECRSDEAKYQSLIDQSKNQENTLQGQISYYDNQIGLAQAQVDEKQAELDQLAGNISSLSGQIGDLQSQLDTLTKVAVKRVRFSEASQRAAPSETDIITGGFNKNTINYAYQQFIQYKDVQIFKQLYNLKTQLDQHKIDLQTQQIQVQQTRDQLARARANLDNQRWAKSTLLSQTRNSEVAYQRLLAQAKAQEQALLAFANARVGSGGSIIPHENFSDGWGSYFNQRDSNWGNVMIGYSSYQVWQVGCLLTDAAMVWNHYDPGDSVTPGMIAANANNFWGSSAALNIPGPVPPGHSSNYVTNPSTDYLRSQLSSGKVIIAGLSFDGGPSPQHYSDHWVVLRGLDGSGHFMINDPWYPGAMNVPLSQNYSYATIIEARIYQ